MQYDKTAKAVDRLSKAITDFTAACETFVFIFVSAYIKCLNAKDKAGE